MPSRRELLASFIAARPHDPFPRYGLALEHKNAGELEDARGVFEALIADHPGYVAAYLHAGNTLVALGRIQDARTVYGRGIEACQQAGDAHARSELEGALAGLPD